MRSTRIKICGLTREEDVLAAVALGADALGFVFYPPSPRNVDIAHAARLVRLLPPFVCSVGLFVNAPNDFVNEVLSGVPLQLLQFHGDERESECVVFGRPWIKAVRMRPEVDLVDYMADFPLASGFVLDTFSDQYGGTGRIFDWSLVPPGIDRPLILSGGLNPGNVGEAIRRVHPWAVDISSGVESEKGIKDQAKMAAFINGVNYADG